MIEVNVIGGGLAGSEAVYYLASKGYKVNLYDLKPDNFTPAHSNKNFGELVCSNSLKGNDPYSNACGLLKEELRILGSFLVAVADQTKVPAGNALAVDREQFAQKITQGLKRDNVNFICQNVTEFNPNLPTIVATGPLTSPQLLEYLGKLTGEHFYFFDAAAPIVSAESIDFSNAFFEDRYGTPGEGDYVNCPMEKDEYLAFYHELINAERAELKDFENSAVFEGCMPVEVMAKRGIDTLRFGPLKPSGLTSPHTGKHPYACVQLRKENVAGQAYNLVGFQTNLLFGEQKRVFSMIPALKNAEFLRYGVMHKNNFINAPKSLNQDLSLKDYPLVFIAGQLGGVEGYVESMATGLLCAINLDLKLNGKTALPLDSKTVLGALATYVTTENANFQPMNANYGILAPLDSVIRDKSLKKKMLGDRAIEITKNLKEIING